MAKSDQGIEPVATGLPDDLDGEQDELVRETMPSARGPLRFLRAPRILAPRTLAALRGGGGKASRAFERRRWLLTLALVLVVLIAGVSIGLVQHFSPQIHYARATQGNLTLSVVASGALQSAVYDTNFAGSGRVAEIDVGVGDTVTQGQTLAKLDTTQLQDALNQAQAALQAAQTASDDANAGLNKVQARTSAQLAYAYDQEQSAIAGCKSNADCIQRAQDQYGAAQAQADNDNAAAQAAVNEAQSQVSVAQAAVQTAQDNLNGAVLVAPHAGTVAAVYGSVGGVAGKSDTSFIRIADLNSLQLLTSISVATIASVQKGQQVSFIVPVSGKQSFQGAVGSVSPVGAVSGGVLSYPVVIDVDMNSVNGANLLPGMAASGKVIVAQRIGVTLVPASSVAFAVAAGDPKHGGFLSRKQVSIALSQARDLVTAAQQQSDQTSADNPAPAYVLEYSSTGKWIAVPVVLGLTDGTSYEVLSGLTPGTKIVSGETNGPVVLPTPTPLIAH
ncbi:MAG: efflux RND transporter periplasmic adaptor subunit [Ktedonobacterales bacterium]